ncbi:MAG: hypothetical protein H0V87_06430 [Chloroflexi bacterium]|nr:hypothetical protein [Chloroflexota bacterium]
MAVVDGEIAQRWECTPAQLLDAGMANLADRLAKVSSTQATVGVVRGRLARLLDTPAGVAASVLLLEDELVRLFGDADQVFLAPSAGRLISFPLSTPPQVIVESALALEMDEFAPLLMDPFVMVDGELHWQSGSGEDYLADHQGWRQSGQPGEL